MGYIVNTKAIRLGGTQKWFLSWVASSSAQNNKFFLQGVYNFKNIVKDSGNLTFPAVNTNNKNATKNLGNNKIKNNFVDGSFTYSHTKIARERTLNITTHFIDALLDAWRIKFSRFSKKRIPILFNPFVKNKRKPRSLLIFKKKKTIKIICNKLFRRYRYINLQNVTKKTLKNHG
jgi:hypothetical protein